MTFLSRPERDYLTADCQEISERKKHNYYCVKSRLLKKLNLFTTQELPLLIEKGYLNLPLDLAECRKQQLAENCKVSSDQ
jgi:hypothetical protein